jgi:hypothetical protein
MLFGMNTLSRRKKMTTRQVYKNPTPGQPLITTISSGCKTPLLEIKYCNLVRPFYYANSPTIPRYSITCLVDPQTHKEFLRGIQTIEKNEKVDTIVKNDYVKEGDQAVTSGKVIVKFQSKDLIPVYVQHPDEDPQPIELEDELARGEKVIVVYDILRYTKKNTMKTEHGLSFKPSCIYYYPNAQENRKVG